ncbi:Z1 domain-containing protein [Peribacillus sp. SCS-26]|uniref:Z1 domain-containing protein n=1 Tax=Paraperibacillus marinus TaxID=3115295 RepID=UPI00390651F6
MSSDPAKILFEQTFSTNYYNLNGHYESQQDAAEQALMLARMLTEGKYGKIEEIQFSQWSLEMFMNYKIGINLTKIHVMKENPEKPWYEPKMTSHAFFWPRYREYLSRIKNWPVEAVDAIDTTTNQIMNALGNPNSLSPFDKRGLVLGYVQSGKTANFTGLINKAYDVGYKLIIVLSGIHNDLRAQTQIRLNEEVVGSTVDKDGNPTGVARIYKNTAEQIISSWTTNDRDISRSGMHDVSNINSKTLMVVKKNKTVLESLLEKLLYLQKLYDDLDVPVLIIDDEADQASVDTSNPDKDEDPRTINRLIRQIIEVFNRKAYVGYTATPFANLLISKDAKTEDEGSDLYPKDFLVGLPKPEEYCGPEEYFNVDEDPDYRRPSLIRHLTSEEIEVFSQLKKKTDADKFEEVPPQMREAILGFILTIAIRNLRGQRKKHNSMLIHTSRLKDVQSTIKDEVENAFDSISKQLLYNAESKVNAELKALYEEDFLVTSKAWEDKLPEFTWAEVYSEIKEAVESIQVFEINGNSKDALDYHQYKEDGLNVIAVGGDKLSRGLTLEGLSITYYFRNTLMYDTLMQMGRWFGYRKGYMDLCRIYTSEEIASHFEHLAIAMIELRQEFDRLAQQGRTPSQYAVKMLSHPSMTLTSPLKMKNAQITNIMYDGTLQQTRLFDAEEEFFSNNMRAASNLVEKLSFTKTKLGSGKTNYFVASDVAPLDVKEFLRDYRTSKNADKVRADYIADYIDLVNENGELIKWTIAVVDGDADDSSGIAAFPASIGHLELQNTVVRGVRVSPLINSENAIDLKALVAPNQEYIDLDQKEIKGIKDRVEKRRIRSKENGLLLFYPLNPNVKVFQSTGIGFSNKLVPVGIAISFPATDIDEKAVYQTNKTVNSLGESNNGKFKSGI